MFKEDSGSKKTIYLYQETCGHDLLPKHVNILNGFDVVPYLDVKTLDLEEHLETENSAWDIPRLDRLFLASPKKDCAVLEQSLGRISRSFPGKKDAICYDYTDRRIGICIGLYKHRFNTYQKMGITIHSGGVDIRPDNTEDRSALSRLFPSPVSCFTSEPEKPLYTSGYPAAV